MSKIALQRDVLPDAEPPDTPIKNGLDIFYEIESAKMIGNLRISLQYGRIY